MFMIHFVTQSPSELIVTGTISYDVKTYFFNYKLKSLQVHTYPTMGLQWPRTDNPPQPNRARSLPVAYRWKDITSPA